MKKNYSDYKNNNKFPLKSFSKIHLLLILFFGLFANAATITITTNTNWSLAGITSVDDVIVRNGATLTVNVTNATCATLQLGRVAGVSAQAGTLTFAATGNPSLTVVGAVIVGGTGNNGSNGTITFVNGSSLITGSVQLGGASSITNGTITMTTGSMLTNNGAFTIGAGGGTKTWNPGAGTVVMNGTNTLPTVFTSFYNLTINAGTTTFGNAKAIANNLSIATGAIANLGTGLTHTAGLLTLGGEGTVPGSWGSTSSGATNQTNTYFLGTGRVNNGCTSPAITTQPVALTICENSGGSFSVSATGASAYQWQYSGDNINWINTDASLAPYVSGYTTTTLTLANTPLSYSGNYIRCIVWSSTGCRANSNSVQLTVKASPLITPNKVNETCPISNNGSISPVFSGGLSNIRYIKLTQKYVNADAWQQVQEIQAFEIFTGTNVALASNGATATASSIYQNNTAGFGPQKAIDGDFTGYNFWHSNSTNTEEFVRVDLASGKNIDYLRIHNRVDCCWERGQNMLLELFDASNNLVYSRTIDLWGGVNGARYIDINVLDVSWSDPATTLNRAGLDSGTYTLNYSDAIGCSISSPIIIGTVNSAPVITTQPSAPTATCSGSGTQSMTVAATGTGLTYDWRLGGVSVANGGVINGQGTATLTLTNPTTANAGNYTVVVSGTCTPAVTSTARTVTVNSAPVITTQPSTPAATCSGSGTQSMTVAATGTGLTYDWQLGGVSIANGGVISGQGTATLTLTNPTTSNAGNYTVVVSGTCTPAVTSTAATVTVNPTPATPKFGTITNTNCVAVTGSIVLEGLPSGNWTINQTGTATASYSGSTATYTVTGLVAGNYTFTVTNANGCPSPATSSQAIISEPSTTWNGSAWSNGVPTVLKAIIFDGDYVSDTSGGDLEGCSCQVNTGKNVIFKSVGSNSGHILKVTNEVTVVGTGTLTFENNASLVQTSDTAPANSGNINYHRHTAPVKRYDFTYWSSPVLGQTLHNLSPNTLGDKYYSYNPASGWKIEYNGALSMLAGNGYIIRAPQYFDINTAAVDTNPVFIGTPNNGVITLPSLDRGVHLLGNPYPSAIDADAFIDFNSSVLEGTLYFWTHNSPPVSSGSTTYSYTANDYATYNRTGGVGTGGKEAITDGAIKKIPTGKIATGQGFFAPVKATGDVEFNNTMRTSGVISGTDNSQFFKLSGTSKTATTTFTREKNRVWLNLTNKQGAFKQALIGYITGATNDYDGGFDGVTYDANPFVDFYSVNNEVNLVIQGRALPFVKKDSVALGYKSTIQGEFQISIDRTDGALATQKIFLEDQDLKVLHDLKKEPYTFNTEKGVFNNRFVLRYVDKNAIEVELSKEVIVSVLDKKITINSAVTTIDKVVLYDMTGRKLFQKNKADANVFVIPNFVWNHQVLVVDVVLSDGTKHIRKVVN